MAQIPRINQGDRPSGVYTPTQDNSLARIAGTLGDMSGAALETATAEEQANRRAYAAAQEEKQRIVDTSNAGRIATEFDSQVFSLRAQLEQKHKDTPELFMEDYSKSMRSLADNLQDKDAYPVNDRVRLAAVKNAESTISSETKSGYGWVSSQQTAQIKGNLTVATTFITNRAASLGSAAAAEGYAESEIAKLGPMMRMVYGKSAGDEEDKLRRDIAERYAQAAARLHPQELTAELESSKFLLSYLKGNHASMVTAADNGYNRLNDTRNLEIAKDAFAAGETLAESLGTEEFIPAAAARVKALKAEKEMAVLGRDASGNRLKPEDAKSRAANLDLQIKRVGVLQEMNYKQLDTDAVDDPEAIRALVTGYKELTAKKAKNSIKKNLELLGLEQDRLVAARDAKKITKGTYDTMRDNLGNLFKEAVKDTKGNDGFSLVPGAESGMFINAEESGVRTLNRLFKTTHSQVSEDVRDMVFVEYTRELNAARKTNKNLGDAEAIAIAKQVLSRKSGKEVTGAFVK